MTMKTEQFKSKPAYVLIQYHNQAAKIGLSYDAAERLRRDAQRLHRLSEAECNGTIERVEDEGRTDHRGRPMLVGKVYAVSGMNRPGPLHYYRTADREMPARDRIEAIAAQIGATVEFQGDPRGWPVTLKLADGRTLSPPVRP
jgi:hypothetical protein